MGCKAGLAGAALAGRRAGAFAASSGLVGASSLGFAFARRVAVPHPLGRAQSPGRPRPTLWSGLPQCPRGARRPPLARPASNRSGSQLARSPTPGFALGFCGPLPDPAGCGVGLAPIATTLCIVAGSSSCSFQPDLPNLTRDRQPDQPGTTLLQPTKRATPVAGRFVAKPAAGFGSSQSFGKARKPAQPGSTGSCGRGLEPGRHPGCSPPRSTR